jgi:two-component system OmpR family sensor kinase
MKNISITTFIHLIFAITIIAITLVFLLFIQLDQQTFNLNQQNRLTIIANTFLTKLKHHPSTNEIDTLAHKLNINPIKKRKIYMDVLNNAKVVHQKEAKYFRFRVFDLKNKQYIYIQSIGYNLMFKINTPKNYSLFVAFFIFILIFFIIFTLYIILHKKITPLKQLNNKIKQFSNGDLSVNIEINTKDEIGQIAKSFNEAIENINSLIESKNLFMKNIIHELKTPITKGLFLTNMIQTDQKDDKESLIKTFTTLNTIINQLSNIEKLKTDKLKFSKEKIDIEGTINQIMIMLDIKDDQLIIEKKDISIIANKDLFGILLKNLIDNGVKYSTKKPVELNVLQNKLIVSSYGEKLNKELSHYTQAFVQEKKNSDGFGLGLYIINEIAKLHNFKLEYEYKDNKNHFILIL